MAKYLREIVQLDELSKGYDSPTSRYLNKARRSVSYDEKQRRPKLLKKMGSTGSVPLSPRPGTNPDLDKLDRKIARRHWGIKKAEAQIRKHGREVEASAEYERTKGAKTFTYKPKVVKSKWSLKEETEINEVDSWESAKAAPYHIARVLANQEDGGYSDEHVRKAKDIIKHLKGWNIRVKHEGPRKKKVHEETELNETDTISLTVPLFIRMLEYAKEDAKTDMDLHKATENILSLSDGDTLDMDSYEEIVSEGATGEKGDPETEKAVKYMKSKGWHRYTDDAIRRSIQINQHIHNPEAVRKSLKKEETELDEGSVGKFFKRGLRTKSQAAEKGAKDAKQRMWNLSRTGAKDGDFQQAHRDQHRYLQVASPKWGEKLGGSWKDKDTGKKRTSKGPGYATISKEETELDEAKRPVYKRTGSMRAQVKTKGDVAKEKAERKRGLRAAVRDMKKTGEKPKIGVRGNQRTWKAARKSAKVD